MADTVEEIKSRLSIYDVVSKYVQLKKAGLNYKGLCPFHSEKSPSFVVSPEKQICHCFGCGKGGDIFTFIQEVEGVSFSDALSILADTAGVKVEKKSSKNFVNKDVKDEYFKAHEIACEYFEDKLHHTNDGKKVLEYLYKRGLNDETIKEFRIGFAPDEYDGLYPLLVKKGISREVMLKSGFVSTKNVVTDKVFDKFRARLMFPIFNYFGKICGFGGRALKKDQMPKYLNSPENPIYNKSKVLYGLSHAKGAIKEEGKVVLVEGYFDVILPWQSGVKNVVATSGTALTVDQVKLLSRLTKNAVSCFDMDNAGFEATVRGYTVMQEQDMLMKTMVLSDGKDPAEFLKQHSKEDFLTIMNKAKTFLSFYIGKLSEKYDVHDMAGRRAVLSELMPLLKKLPSTSKDFYLGELSTKVGVEKSHLYDELNNFTLPKNHPARAKVAKVAPAQAFKINAKELLLAICLYSVDAFVFVHEKLDEKYFDNELKSIYNTLMDQYNLSRSLDKWDLGSMFADELGNKVNVLYLYAEDKYGDFGTEALKNETIILVHLLEKQLRERDIKNISDEIRLAEESKDMEKLQELLKRLTKITNTHGKN